MNHCSIWHLEGILIEHDRSEARLGSKKAQELVYYFKL